MTEEEVRLMRPKGPDLALVEARRRQGGRSSRDRRKRPLDAMQRTRRDGDSF
jgi:hypothetical protein